MLVQVITVDTSSHCINANELVKTSSADIDALHLMQTFVGIGSWQRRQRERGRQIYSAETPAVTIATNIRRVLITRLSPSAWHNWHLSCCSCFRYFKLLCQSLFTALLKTMSSSFSPSIYIYIFIYWAYMQEEVFCRSRFVHIHFLLVPRYGRIWFWQTVDETMWFLHVIDYHCHLPMTTMNS